MKIKIQKKIGDTTFEFEIQEEKERDAIFQAGTIASMPSKCDCGSTDLTLVGNKAKGYTFAKVACNQCTAVSQLGEYKEGGIFWKKFEKYQPKPETSSPNEYGN